MFSLLRISTLVLLFSCIGFVKADENPPPNLALETLAPITADNSSKETRLPIPEAVHLETVSLEEAIKIVMQDSKNKLLGAKTEIEDGHKIHIIKILTSEGYIQYVRIDAVNGKIVNRTKK
jgi:uncharacterized membrane protein YkoI